MAVPRLFRASPPLLALFVSMLVLGAVALAGLVLDPRVITGAPAWLKPLKFAISVAVYAASFAWLLGHLRGRERLVRVVGQVNAWTLALELALIFLQAARGTTSHFNLATPLDQAIFNAMGIAIVVLWVAQLVTAVALLRQRFDDPAFGWSLRLGLLLTIAGAAVGFFMVVPTPAQLELARAGHGMALSGAHTVGGPDGGAGLPFVGWSREHGDLRPAHFFGLHALQLLPLVAWALAQLGLSAATRKRLVFVSGASSFALLVLLVVQALRGEPVLSPSPATATAFAVWLAATLGAAVRAALPARPAALARVAP